MLFPSRPRLVHRVVQPYATAHDRPARELRGASPHLHPLRRRPEADEPGTDRGLVLDARAYPSAAAVSMSATATMSAMASIIRTSAVLRTEA